MPVPKDGSITPASGPFVYEDRVNVSCNDKYNLNGTEVYECGPSKKFIGSYPNCVRTYCYST